MRALVLLAFAGCTLGSGAAPGPHDPDPMPSTVLEHQDPAADTSKHPVLWRSEAHYQDPREAGYGWCMKVPTCAVGNGEGVLLVAATVAFACRRRRKP